MSYVLGTVFALTLTVLILTGPLWLETLSEWYQTRKAHKEQRAYLKKEREMNEKRKVFYLREELERRRRDRPPYNRTNGESRYDPID